MFCFFLVLGYFCETQQNKFIVPALKGKRKNKLEYANLPNRSGAFMDFLSGHQRTNINGHLISIWCPGLKRFFFEEWIYNS